MPATTILTPGTGAGTSSTVVLANGATATIGLYVVSGLVPQDVIADVVLQTPGAQMPVATLTAGQNCIQVDGPGDYLLIRKAATVAVGGFAHT